MLLIHLIELLVRLVQIGRLQYDGRFGWWWAHLSPHLLLWRSPLAERDQLQVCFVEGIELSKR